ncbi:MAG: hypothetical protein LC793_14670 [Thermomicrobia bacterium]|nr:hypothetical protein [Thermomicrobia bacterium]MCA1723807.1 hypothetical protein [Thermomicrobia bacterium]
MNMPETMAIRVIGPHTGRRIAGTSEDVADVYLARRYRFEGFEITVQGIPARRDNATGALYLSARDMKHLTQMVDELADAVRRQQTQRDDRSIVRHVPLKLYRDFPLVA